MKYNWKDFTGWITENDYNFEAAYHKDIIGAREFSRFSRQGLMIQEEGFRELFRSRPKKMDPCLFVSHRRDDEKEALRVAKIATDLGYDIFLDVLDHKLQQMTDSHLIANRIEIALLNSTHVIALITPNTEGSMWVPYEYGRVKEYQVVSSAAGCWIHPDLPHPYNKAEYLQLGVMNYSEQEIKRWLRKELRPYQPVFPGTWTNGTTTPLPT